MDKGLSPIRASPPQPPFYACLTQRLFEVFARGVFCCYCPLRISGREHLPPMPFLICSNHASHMDSIVLMAASGCRFGCFGLLAASDYFFRSPLVYRCFSSLVNLIPIDRAPTPHSLHLTLSLCRNFLAGERRALILFPEGTRSASGTLGAFKRGPALFSAKLGIPIVPAYVEGTREAMPKGRFFPAPRRVSVRFGAPIPAAGNGGDGLALRAYRDVAVEARSRIAAMRGARGDA